VPAGKPESEAVRQDKQALEVALPALEERARAVKPEPAAAQRAKLEQVAAVLSKVREAGRGARVRPVREAIEASPAVGPVLVGGSRLGTMPSAAATAVGDIGAVLGVREVTGA